MKKKKPFFTLKALIISALLFSSFLLNAQTNPTAQNLTLSQNFGTTTFTAPPTGMAAWTVTSSPKSSQASAESSTPNGDATITAATSAQTTGGCYGYSTSSNGRFYIQTSSNATNGTNQLAAAIVTTNLQNIKVSYDIEMISVTARTVGVVLQYRIGTSGSWTTVSGSVYAHNSSDRSAGQVDNFTNLSLPAAADNNSVVQLRWAIWRGTEAGNSSGIAIDNVSITGSAIPTAYFFRSKQTGNWNSTSSWEMSSDSSSWVNATFVPDFNCKTISILSGHQITLTASDTVDQLIVNGTFTYGDNSGNVLTINNGTGVDLKINGTFEDFGPSSIAWLSSTTWEMGSSGTLVRSRSTSSNNWRDHYSGGIENIPATAYWILRKNSGDSPSITSTGGMYYPNLTFENNTASEWVTGGSSTFNGYTDYPRIKGNLDIGGSGSNIVSFLNENTNANPVLVEGNLAVQSGSTLRNYGTGFEIKGNLTVNGAVNYDSDNDRKLVFSGTNAQSISGSGTLNIYYLGLNKTSNNVSLSKSITVDNLLSLSGSQIILGSYNLTIASSASINGAGSSTYVQTNSTGKLIKKYASTGSAFTFTVGDGTYYTPYSLTLNSATLGGDPYIAVRVINSAESHVTGFSDYINRYWDVNINDITNLDAEVSYLYADNDITGTESNFVSVLWNSTDGLKYAGTVSPSTNTASCDDISAVGNFTVAGICNYSANAGNDTIISLGDSVQIGSNPIGGYTYLWSPAEGLSSTTVANPWAKPDSAITYTVSMYNGYGCEKTDEIDITVVNINFTIDPDTVFLWDSVTLTNTSFGLPENTWYKWSFVPCLYSLDTNVVVICDTITFGKDVSIHGFFDLDDSANITLTPVDSLGNSLLFSPETTEIALLNPLVVCPPDNCDETIIDSCVNLVCNGNFEFYTTCPNNQGQLCYAAPWVTTPTLDPSSPDYFNGCAPGFISSVPFNFFGTSFAHSGDAYAGYISYLNSGNPAGDSNRREYIQAKLKTELIAGQKYKIEMYVNLAGKSKFESNGVQVYFSNILPEASHFTGLITGVTGSSNYIDLAPFDDDCIENWNFWTKLTKNYIPTTTGLTYISVGNFKKDTDTSFHYHSLQIGTLPDAYIYVDDIVVKLAPIPEALPNDTICFGDTVTIIPHYPCSLTWSSVPFDSTLIGQEHNDTIYVAPEVTTVYSITTDDPDIDTSITITVLPPPEITFEGPNNTCDTIEAYTITDYQDSYIYTYNIDHDFGDTIHSDVFEVDWLHFLGGGMLYVEVTNPVTGCTGIDSIRVFACCPRQPSIVTQYNNTTISSDPSASFFVINGTVTISGDITFNNKTIYMGPNSIIKIPDSDSLHILNSALIAGECDTMWDGIYIYGTDAFLEVEKSTIMDAKNAVVSIDGGVFEIDYLNVFENNYRNIVVKPYNNPHSGKLWDTEIKCTSTLLTQYPPINATRTYSGVELENVDQIIIGDQSNFANRNIFKNLDYGIINSGSEMYVFNNRFDSILAINAGKAIMVNGSKFHPAKAVIGYDYTSGSVKSNYFYKCLTGIYSSGVTELTVKSDTTEKSGFASVYCITNAYRHTDIENNLLQDGRYGVAIKQTSKTSDYFVKNNKVSNTLFGICFENATPLSFDTLRVTDNFIDLSSSNGSRGVLFTRVKGSKGHLSLIRNNSIRFSNNPITNSFYYYGIRLQNTYLSIVDSNYIFRTVTSMDSTNAKKVIGIYTKMSPSVRIGANDINRMGYGMYCEGTEPYNKMYCNILDTCFHSVQLLNANIGTQGSNNMPWDNQFLNNTGYYKMYGSVVVLPLHWWYFQLGSTPYPYLALPANVISLNYTQTSNGNFCGSVLMNYPDTNNLLQYIDTVSLRYYEADIDTISVESDYQNVVAAFKILTDDDWLMNLGRDMDDTLTAFYDNVKLSNIGYIETIYDSIGNEAYEDALSLNSSLDVNSKAEENTRFVNDVFLNTWAQGIFEFSSYDSTALYGIATKNPSDDGEGVYGARVMLGLDLDEEGNSLKTAPPVVENIVADENLLIYPNPSTGEINIYSNGTLLNQNAKLTVFNSMGYVVQKIGICFNKEPLSINLSDLRNGVYYYELKTLNSEYSGKIVILK